MRTKIHVSNFTKEKIGPERVRKIIRKAVSVSSVSKKDLDVAVVFLDEKTIADLNRRYRKKNQATDILSFNYTMNYNRKEAVKVEGELILCPDYIRESSRKSKTGFQEELAFVLSHGVFHLFGMRHGKKMYGLQDEVVRQLKSK